MCRKCRKNLHKFKLLGEVQIIHKDIRDLNFQNSEIIIMNYILQFIPTELKLSVMKKICQSLPTRGILILSEKINQQNASLQKLYTDIYSDFKQSRGYTELEIAQKREALENILLPLGFEELQSLLRKAGFNQIKVFFQWFNFLSLIAEK